MDEDLTISRFDPLSLLTLFTHPAGKMRLQVQQHERGRGKVASTQIPSFDKTDREIGTFGLPKPPYVGSYILNGLPGQARLVVRAGVPERERRGRIRDYTSLHVG